MITIDRRHVSYLGDYCPRCCPAGIYADRPVRLASLTEPDAVTWRGGKRLTCEYRCNRCGHHWSRSDLWGAQEAGFDPKRRRAA